MYDARINFGFAINKLTMIKALLGAGGAGRSSFSRHLNFHPVASGSERNPPKGKRPMIN